MCPLSIAVVALMAALAAVEASPGVRATAPQSPVAAERGVGPTVDFIALNADGTPVPDLQMSDIEIRLGDRVRAVRALRRVSVAPGPASALQVPAPFGTNGDVAAGRRFLLVIDQESFAAGREQLFRDAIEGLLGEFTPADQALVFAWRRGA
jgi:hypothetical protein